MQQYGWRDQLTFDFAMETFYVSNRQPTEVFAPFVKWSAHGHENTVVPTVSLAKSNASKKSETPVILPDAPPSLAIIIQSPPNWVPLVPLFVMAALEHNPDAHVTVMIHPNYPMVDMEAVVARHGVMNYLVVPHSLMSGSLCPTESAHFMALPAVQRDMVFICPIWHMITHDLLKTYLPIMRAKGLDYVNVRDEFDVRLSPIHFSKWEAMYPHNLMTRPGQELFKHAGFNLARVVQTVTNKPLHFVDQLPTSGWDVVKKKGDVNGWINFAATDAFGNAVSELTEQAVDWLRTMDNTAVEA
jgi:hypothetical protein